MKNILDYFIFYIQVFGFFEGFPPTVHVFKSVETAFGIGVVLGGIFRSSEGLFHKIEGSFEMSRDFVLVGVFYLDIEVLHSFFFKFVKNVLCHIHNVCDFQTVDNFLGGRLSLVADIDAMVEYVGREGTDVSRKIKKLILPHQRLYSIFRNEERVILFEFIKSSIENSELSDSALD